MSLKIPIDYKLVFEFKPLLGCYLEELMTSLLLVSALLRHTSVNLCKSIKH